MCYGIQGLAPTGDYGGYFTGGMGVYAESDDNAPALDAHAVALDTYAVSAISAAGRGAYVKSPAGYYGLYVDNGVSNYGAVIVGNTGINGNLTVTGSKSGYVVDAMQNADTTALEPGDVVVIVGNSAPVLGQIPVITVRKAARANDTGVAGVVDQALYVPDATTKAAYAAQQDAQRAAQTARAQAQAAATAQGTKPAAVPQPPAPITDAQGSVHALADATQVAPGGYANVVTLGAYKAVKVDTRFGPIHAGDLLTTSPHAGYAQVVTDKAAAMGAVIGKALADLTTGTGTIPVLVTLK
ncbi:MAG TPA: hypothetical protein VKY74_27495 [Chloroflexia bacterium]|nr:hypothetical protein [Chloroflexia bacterium]